MTPMLIITFLLSLFTFKTVQAQTVLIPDMSVTAEDYNKKCQADGYTCIQSYQLNTISAQPTPLFDSFIDSIDLLSKSFLSSMPKQVQRILQEEMISPEQLDMLCRLLEQAPSEQSRILLNEIKYITHLLQKEKRINLLTQDFIVFFKTPLSLGSLARLNKTVVQLPYFEITYNQVATQQKIKNKSRTEPIFLVTGSCETAVPSLDMDSTKWKIISEKSCGWSKDLQQTSKIVVSNIKENKNWIVIGSLLVGAAVLSSQYELKFQF